MSMKFARMGLLILIFFLPSALSAGQFTNILPYCHVTHRETPWQKSEVVQIWKAMRLLGADPEVASLLAPFIHREAGRFGVDPFVMVSMARQESNFRLDARGSKGEIGVFQIRPDVWAGELGLTEKELEEPANNTYACAAILAKYLSRYEGYRSAVRAYNHRRYGARYAQAVLHRVEEVVAEL